jgi:hypothetical protein
LSKNPLLQEEQVHDELDQLLKSSNVNWNNVKVNFPNRVYTETPKSVLDLTLLDMASGIVVRITLLVQMEERYTYRVIETPGSKSFGRIWSEQLEYSDDFPVISILDSDRQEQTVPRSLEKIPCKNCKGTGKLPPSQCSDCNGTGTGCSTCNGAGVVEKDCRSCEKGRLISYRKRVRHVYPEKFVLFEYVNPGTQSGNLMQPIDGFDVLWSTTIQERPFDAIPLSMGNSNSKIVSDMQSALTRKTRDIISRTQQGAIKYTKDEHWKATAYEVLTTFSEAFEVGFIHETDEPQIESICANYFQILVEATPVYKLKYNREVKYSWMSGCNWIKRWLTQKETIETSIVDGEICLQGTDKLKMFSQTESFACKDIAG